MHVIDLGPGHIRAYRDADHPDLIEAARPFLRAMVDQADIEATDDELDQMGTACRAAGTSYSSAIALINAYRGPWEARYSG